MLTLGWQTTSCLYGNLRVIFHDYYVNRNLLLFLGENPQTTADMLFVLCNSKTLLLVVWLQRRIDSSKWFRCGRKRYFQHGLPLSCDLKCLHTLLDDNTFNIYHCWAIGAELHSLKICLLPLICRKINKSSVDILFSCIMCCWYNTSFQWVNRLITKTMSALSHGA